ncbi:MAG TPA: MaoC family dehydratase [Dehalococcoidia bacterium]|nr:MaoC family dehydratase [Dehalococcoidia bacterium]
MADELTYDSIEVGRKYGPWEYQLAERFPRYLEAAENAHAWHSGRSPWGPPVAPPTLLGLAAMRMMDEVGPVPPGTLHARQEIETAAALRLDRRPHAYGEFIDKYEKRGRKYFKFQTRWRDETGIILGHSTVTMVYPPESDEERAPSGERPERKGELSGITRTVTQEKMTAYAEDSANVARGESIHIDPNVAKAAGFERTVANGLIAADYIGELMTDAFGKDWFEDAGLSVAFLKPILQGDTVTTNARLSETVSEGAVERRVYEVWAENQDGDAVAAGHAYSLVIPGAPAAISP